MDRFQNKPAVFSKPRQLVKRDVCAPIGVQGRTPAALGGTGLSGALWGKIGNPPGPLTYSFPVTMERNHPGIRQSPQALRNEKQSSAQRQFKIKYSLPLPFRFLLTGFHFFGILLQKTRSADHAVSFCHGGSSL